MAISPLDTAPAAPPVEATRELRELRTKVAQLQIALESRIVIEQAKGVLSERHRVSLDVAFEALRRGSRTQGRKIRDVARDVLESRSTPPAVASALAAH